MVERGALDFLNRAETRDLVLALVRATLEIQQHPISLFSLLSTQLQIIKFFSGSFHYKKKAASVALSHLDIEEARQ